ncbi:choice-of-anchor E domain-containing protein [Haliscomenobacter sp.]|uniref:choice-of-anchor E domain-containing protein n=1 Tax=Haliscomenobacter sp. TaxID=2717303 RepID=UPI0035938E60
MKKNYDLLHTGSGMLKYCPKAITRLWENSPHHQKMPKGTLLYFALPLVTLFLWTDFVQNSVDTTANRIIATVESCNEVTFLNNSQPTTLSLPKFDPALGTLRSVEIMTECMIMADVAEKEVKGNNYALLLNVDLTAELPNQAPKVHQSSAKFSKTVRDEGMQQNGFTETFKDAKQNTELITTNLAAFTGSGNLNIPLSVNGLINFKDDVSTITSNLKAKICIKYNYD